ncbi:(2Fe-2S)-binding protein [Paenibacillus humicus]|uniref:(2Fe-2S)-binding protein n=1 Tax=Paenibacillus humicus TaxID=412861 RepID=UPI003F5CBF3B
MPDNDSPKYPEGEAKLEIKRHSAAASIQDERIAEESGPQEPSMPEPVEEEDGGEPPFELTFRLNGEERTIGTWPARRMLTLLREDLGLTGTKRSCEIGRCGACMVLLDGEPVNSCLLSAYQCSGADLVTIEGLQGERAGRVKAAFLQEGGFQCGYCTPGMVISVSSLLEHNPCPSRLETEEALAGNICRCTGYGSIFRAVCRASEGQGEMPPAE